MPKRTYRWVAPSHVKKREMGSPGIGQRSTAEHEELFLSYQAFPRNKSGETAKGKKRTWAEDARVTQGTHSLGPPDRNPKTQPKSAPRTAGRAKNKELKTIRGGKCRGGNHLKQCLYTLPRRG